VYTLTIRGDSFAGEKISTPIHSSVTPFGDGTGTAAQSTAPPPNPATCTVAKEAMATDGSANVEVHCFAYDARTGWLPADAAFDVQVVGPGR
jgi:hypothetical protein